MDHELPSGAVTLLFTDIEGSTRLLNELGAEAYEEALAEHRRLLRRAFAQRGGVEVDTQGDAFFYAFPSASAAIEAAREGQQGLAVGPIRVRMGVHAGRPHVGREGYVGEDVHLAARIAAAGHGGEVLVSQATRALVDGKLVDLGEHGFDETALRGFGAKVMRPSQKGRAFKLSASDCRCGSLHLGLHRASPHRLHRGRDRLESLHRRWRHLLNRE